MKYRLLLAISLLALWCWTHPPVLQIWTGPDREAILLLRANGATCWPTRHGVRIQANSAGVQALAEMCAHLQLRREVILQNIANAHTQKTYDGAPYRRSFVSVDAQGRSIASIDKKSDFLLVYDPANPNAIQEGDHKGYVPMPNVNVQAEQVWLEYVDVQSKQYHQALEKLAQMVDPQGRMHLDPVVSEPAPGATEMNDQQISDECQDDEVTTPASGVSFEHLVNSLSSARTQPDQR